MKKRTKTILWIVVAVAVVALAVWFFAGRSTPTAQSEETVRTGEISTYYTFSGTVEVDSSQRVQASAPATVREVYVKKGDPVRKDDRLLRLSTGETIKATVAGEVAELPVEKDDDVAVGDLLCEVIDFDNLKIEVKVDEFDAKAITVGKEVEVTINALDETFTATIDDVSKRATVIGDISYYIAEITPEPIEGILPGMQVDVRALNEKVENATLIPMKAVQFDEYDAPYVSRKNSSGRAEKVSITVGINDGVQVQVISGVQSGDTVFIPRTGALSDMMGMWGGVNE